MGFDSKPKRKLTAAEKAIREKNRRLWGGNTKEKSMAAAKKKKAKKTKKKASSKKTVSFTTADGKKITFKRKPKRKVGRKFNAAQKKAQKAIGICSKAVSKKLAGKAVTPKKRGALVSACIAKL